MGSKAFGVGAGLLTGGVAGGAMALAPNSPGKAMLGLGMKAFGGADKPVDKPLIQSDFEAGATDLVQPAPNAFARRMEMLKQGQTGFGPKGYA